MSSVMVVGGGSRNIRITALLGAMGVIVNKVTTIYSPFEFPRFGAGSAIAYQETLIHRRLVDDHAKYNEKKIQQRRKSLQKRHEQKKVQMARKEARKREKSFVGTW